MILACLFMAAPAVVPPVYSNSRQSTQDLATRLAAARGFGSAGAITGTPDGKYIFSAEGASLAVIEPGREVSTGDGPDRNFDDPIKKVELGAFRPSIVRMTLDPEADLSDGTSLVSTGHPLYRNYLFLAAGPNGLWIADADKSAGVANRIARVDDSGTLPAPLTSDRHCNDVDIVTLRGQSFVVATFAARGDSQLRFYRIEDVRAVLGSARSGAPETGREISPLLTVGLGSFLSGTPFSTFTVGPDQIARSFASELVVDQGDPNAGETYIYVAMRTDGIARVRVRHKEILEGQAAAGTVVWGPRFGDDSYHATHAPNGLFTDNRDVYDNVRWINQQFDPDRLERSDPPFFTALAVHGAGVDRTGRPHGHKLYAAVDALGFVVLDLEDPAAWGQTMPIDHHEGVPVDLQGNTELVNPGAWPERIVGTRPKSGASSVSELIGYIRAMAVVDASSGLKLVATYSGSPTLGDTPLFLEGFAYDDQFQYGGVSYSTAMRGERQGTTRVFNISDLPKASPEIRLTRSVAIETGGSGLFVPPIQTNQLGGDSPAERLEFVHVGRSSIAMTSIQFGAARTSSTIVATRERDLVVGRRTFGLQQSLVDPNLIMTSDNDGHPREGLLYLLGSPGNRSLGVDYDASAVGGNDRRLSSGVIMGRDSQWLDARLGPNQHAAIGAGRARPGDASAGVPARPATHMVSIQTIPSTFQGAPAVEEFKVNLVQRRDRWNRVGRAFYLGGMVNPRYDAWVQDNVAGLGSAEYFFLFRQETPDGLLFGRRDVLMDLLTSDAVENGQDLTPEDLDGAGVEMRSLNTHPEFDGFPFHPSDTGYRAAAAWFTQPASPHPYRQRVKTWEPEMIRVRPAKGSSASDGWVLAAPCGVSVLGSEEHPDLADVSLTPSRYQRLEEVSIAATNGDPIVGDPDWLPDSASEEAAQYGHGLVQFWDFTDPSHLPVVPGAPEGSSSLARVYLPIAAEETDDPDDIGRSSFAWHLEGLELKRRGELHSYAIVGDFLGGVHAYEITDILSGVAPTLEASWYAPSSRQDVLTNNVRGLVIDRGAKVVHAYVAVQRVGVIVLRIDVDAGGALSLTEVARLDDIKEPLSLHLRVVEGTGERLLYVCDHRQAMRVYSSDASDGGVYAASGGSDSKGARDRTLPASITPERTQEGWVKDIVGKPSQR